jgi:hypothetical protein
MTVETEQEKLIRHLKGVREIVINACHGGYGLSQEAELLYLKKSLTDYTTKNRVSRYDTERYGLQILVNGNEWRSKVDIRRDDPVLVSVVQELGSRANGEFAELKIVEIPAFVDWQIDEYDGREWIAETHRTWN